MSLFPSIAIFFVIWWLCLFLTLPFGNASQAETGDITPGTERAAPLRPRLVTKALATTILASIVFGCVYLAFGVYGLTLEDLVF